MLALPRSARLTRSEARTIADRELARLRQLTAEWGKIVRVSDAADEILRHVVKAARSDLDDETCRQELEVLAKGNVRALRDALRSVPDVDSFDMDRARRLLGAVFEGRAVEPVSPAKAELYEAERRLMHLPRREAFEELAARQPRLHDVLDRVHEKAEANAGGELSMVAAGRRVLWIEKLIADLVGSRARSDDPLVRSPTAHFVVRMYLSKVGRAAAQLGGDPADDAS